MATGSNHYVSHRRTPVASAIPYVQVANSSVLLQPSRLLVALLLLLLLHVIFIGAASAHTNLVASQPEPDAVLEQAPERVAATFTEELDSDFSRIRVFDAEGNQVDSGDGGIDLNDLEHASMDVSLPPLIAGTYTVRWEAVSIDDGDQTEGSFRFTIGDRAAASGIAAQPASNRSKLLIGGLASGALLLLAFAVIYARRRQVHVD